MHAHGGGGHDFTECTEEAFRTAIAAHMKHCLLYTSGTTKIVKDAGMEILGAAFKELPDDLKSCLLYTSLMM